MIQKNKKKVIVALSGGVDSAVSAALLKKRGLEVVGVFFDLVDWPASTRSRVGRGGGSKGLENAKKIAKKLGIPFKIVEARKEFKKKIIDYFIKEYKSGVTPNPCVICNKEMKFRLLLDLIKKEKADYIATGHYARLRREFPISNFQFPNNFKISKFQNVRLLEAKDKSKDQSYFLYRLTQKDLAKIIFPLGNYKKKEVKKIAKKLGLPTAKEESQDICFLPDKELSDFLKKYIKPKPGNIIDEEGKKLGKHRGLPLYTIGQRKGIEIGPPRLARPLQRIEASESGEAGGTKPYFVLRKNPRRNELTVTNDPQKLFVKKFKVRAASWVKKGVRLPLRAEVQIRYHAEKIPAIIRLNRTGGLTVEARKPLRAVTPGQSAVFYRDSEVLGGGIIV